VYFDNLLFTAYCSLPVIVIRSIYISGCEFDMKSRDSAENFAALLIYYGGIAVMKYHQ